MKFKLEIEIDQENNDVSIKDSRKDEPARQFKGIHVVAAGADASEYYVVSYGVSKDIGKVMAQVFNDGWSLPYMRSLFWNFTEWINKFFVNVGDGYDLSEQRDRDEIEEIFGRWDEEDEKKEENKKPIIH